MDEFVDSILNAAILKEKAAQKLYTNLEKNAKSADIKKLFRSLAEEEELHEMLFSKMDVGLISIVNYMPLKRLSMLKDIEKKDLMTDEIKDINKALEFAINEEQKAYQDYGLLIKYLDFGPAKEALKAIAQQELKHKTSLEKLKLDFNDHDWTSLKRG